MGTQLPSPQKGGGPSKFLAHVYCNQTPGWMKLVLRMEVDLSLGDFQSPSHNRGRSPLPNFRPISIVAKRLDALKCHLVWMLASAQGLCVRWRPSPPSPTKRGRSPLPIFRPFLLCPNGWMHQDATRYGGRPQPRRVCVRWGPSPPPPKGTEPLPNFKGLG